MKKYLLIIGLLLTGCATATADPSLHGSGDTVQEEELNEIKISIYVNGEEALVCYSDRLDIRNGSGEGVDNYPKHLSGSLIGCE